MGPETKYTLTDQEINSLVFSSSFDLYFPGASEITITDPDNLSPWTDHLERVFTDSTAQTLYFKAKGRSFSEPLSSSV